MIVLSTLFAAVALVLGLLFAPIFKPRGRLTKIRGNYRITPEIEKARNETQNRLRDSKDERG